MEKLCSEGQKLSRNSLGFLFRIEDCQRNDELVLDSEGRTQLYIVLIVHRNNCT
jgi:hypothetical protein